MIKAQKHLGEEVHTEVVDAASIQLGHPLDVFRGVRPTKHLVYTQHARAFTKQEKSMPEFFLRETLRLRRTNLTEE